MDPNHPLRSFEAEKRAQRAANEQARARGEPLPYPNPWVALDPTKLPPGASPEEIHRRYLAFREVCRAPQCKRYTI